MSIEESLGASERQVSKELESTLAAHAAVSERAFNSVGLTLSAAPEAPISQVSLARRTVSVLMVRLSNDLRVVALTGLRGYALQAASLASSMYEVAYGIVYIGGNDTRAEAWVNHDDPTRPFRNIRTLTTDVARSLGVDNPDQAAAGWYRVYRQLCLVKHSNPIVQRDHGHYSDTEENAEFVMNGPDAGEASVRVAKFALEHATRLTVLALASFIDNHVPADRRVDLVERLNAIRREVAGLAQDAISEFGNDDPYPGKW